MKHEPFDLERALSGEPVMTRNKKEISHVMKTRFSRKYPIIAVDVDGKVYSYTKQGKYYANGHSSMFDLVMKPQTRVVNGFEVPAPVTNPDNMVIGDTYYRADSSHRSWFFRNTWAGDGTDKMWLERGLVFLRKEPAIVNAKAMVGIGPYGDTDKGE